MTKYKITYSSKFKKDFKKYQYETKELQVLTEAFNILIETGATSLPERMKVHKLVGNYKGLWECHIFPDFLLVWDEEEAPKYEIHLMRLGSHAELFT